MNNGPRQHRFEISVKGDARSLLSSEFDDGVITVDRSVTVLRLTVRDDAALHGLLERLEMLGLELLSVEQLERGPSI